MDEGLNIMYFARKEQCLALGAQLRTKFKPRIENFAIYRIFPNGESQFLHPADGVFPEKVLASPLTSNRGGAPTCRGMSLGGGNFLWDIRKDVKVHYCHTASYVSMWCPKAPQMHTGTLLPTNTMSCGCWCGFYSQP